MQNRIIWTFIGAILGGMIGFGFDADLKDVVSGAGVLGLVFLILHVMGTE